MESFTGLLRLNGTNAAHLRIDDDSQTAHARDRSADRRTFSGRGDHRLLHADAVLLACLRRSDRIRGRAQRLLHDDHLLRLSIGEDRGRHVVVRRCPLLHARAPRRCSGSCGSCPHARDHRYIAPCNCAATARRAIHPPDLILTTLVHSRTLS